MPVLFLLPNDGGFFFLLFSLLLAFALLLDAKALVTGWFVSVAFCSYFWAAIPTRFLERGERREGGGSDYELWGEGGMLPCGGGGDEGRGRGVPWVFPLLMGVPVSGAGIG